MFLPLLIGKVIGDAIGGANASAAHEKNINAAMDVQRDILSQQQGIYNQSRQDNMPWLDAGRTSLADLMRAMQSGQFDTRVDANSLQNDPGYQFRMAQGQKALERSAAARGGLNSGRTMMGLAKFSQGLASDEFQNAWSRNQAENAARFGRMSGVAGMGQNSAQYLGQLGQQHSGTLGNYANSMSQLYGAKGNAQAAGAMAFPNAFGSGVNTLSNMATAAIGAYSGMGGMGGGGQRMPTQMPSQQQALPMQGSNPYSDAWRYA